MPVNGASWTHHDAKIAGCLRCRHARQLARLVSSDETGLVDRKLNVALTRVRQQLVLLGNPEILVGASHHAALLRRVLGYSTRRPE